jgi:thioesterase domain-containing protein
LAPDQPVAILDLPSELEERLRTSIEEEASLYVQQLRAFQPHGPYYLCGLSATGIVAFEMALQLQAQGETIALLALLDTVCPAAPVVPWLWAAVPGLAMLRAHYSVWRSLDPGEKLSFGLRKARAGLRLLAKRAAGARQQADARDPAMPLHAVPYVPGLFNGQITLFVACAYAAGTLDVLDARLAWRHFATDGLEVHRLPGDHFFFWGEPLVARRTAAHLRRCMRRAQERVGACYTDQVPSSGMDHGSTED